VEAEKIAETKLHRIQGSALRWPLSYYQPQFSKRVAEVAPVWAAAPVWVAVLAVVLAPAVVPMVLARPFALTLFLLTSEKDADAHRSRCV